MGHSPEQLVAPVLDENRPIAQGSHWASSVKPVLVENFPGEHLPSHCSSLESPDTFENLPAEQRISQSDVRARSGEYVPAEQFEQNAAPVNGVKRPLSQVMQAGAPTSLV